MVLETGLTRLCTAIFCFICYSCSAENKIMDSTTIDNIKLVITESNGVCYLEYTADKKQVIALQPNPPCYFVRRGGDKVISFTYADVNVLSALLVVGTPISEQKRKEWNLGATEYCGEKGQGILISKSGIHVSTRILDGGVLCPRIGVDEKNYWHVAH